MDIAVVDPSKAHQLVSEGLKKGLAFRIAFRKPGQHADPLELLGPRDERANQGAAEKGHCLASSHLSLARAALISWQILTLDTAPGGAFFAQIHTVRLEVSHGMRAPAYR